MNIKQFFAILFILGIISIIFRLTGCSTAQQGEIPQSTTTTTTVSGPTTTTIYSGYREYYPNQDGLSWTYRRAFSNSPSINTEKITYCGTSEFNSQIVQIARRETIFPEGTISTAETIFKVDNFAVYRLRTVESTPILMAVFGFPLQVGIHTGVTDVLALETVTVPAGTFNNCFKLSAAEGDFTYISWLAPNVGMVKAEKRGVSAISTAELTGKNF